MKDEKIKILLLEPHPTAARMLCMMLSAFEGLELVRVRSFKEAEGLSRCWNYDLLMGFLPGEELDGLADYLRLKKLAGKRPLVILSGAASREVADFAVQLGASAVIDRSSLNPGSVHKILSLLNYPRVEEPLVAAA